MNKPRALALLSISLAVLTACSTTSVPIAQEPSVTPGAIRPQSSTAVDVWVTHPDRSRLISWDGTKNFVNDGNVTASTLTINEGQTFQTMEGFGASLTDSAGWLMWYRMSAAQRNNLIQSLFGFNDGNAGISFLRIPLGGSDMAVTHYTYNDGTADPSLSRFSIGHDLTYIVPIARQAKTINSSIRYMGTPWSPPAWMKDSGSLNYGKLKPEYYQTYANYLKKTYDAYNAQGIRFNYMSVQNEPRFEPGLDPDPAKRYPGTKYEWYDELNLVRYNVAPTFNGTGVKFLTLDHNWDLGWYADAVLREGSAYYEGSAWHCYAGDTSTMVSTTTYFRNTYPNKGIFFTECSGTFEHNNFGDNLKWNMQNLFIGGTKNGAKTVALWSLAQDPYGNPHLGGCGNCRGVVTINQSNGAVTLNEEFYSIAHFARFVWPGAVRIGSTDSSDGKFTGVAFRNTNGSKALVVLNQSSSTATFKMVWNGKSIQQTLPAKGVATVFW
ncbi:glycoside hydrolase family 30 protein [Deinococcus misasensis]|uniref:glycoside hydrolase family 30 protein n=1 Tax=Deinococcus misasensis TaxID=392413 RepID=UPI00054F3216|nr:glycoside hydrolase family 30 beta sandwich domain-containing protein [Deinococcus misasensis]